MFSIKKDDKGKKAGKKKWLSYNSFIVNLILGLVILNPTVINNIINIYNKNELNSILYRVVISSGLFALRHFQKIKNKKYENIRECKQPTEDKLHELMHNIE